MEQERDGGNDGCGCILIVLLILLLFGQCGVPDQLDRIEKKLDKLITERG